MNRTLAARASAMFVVCALAAQAWSQAGPAPVPTGIDAQALQSLANANQHTALALELGTCASERSAVAGAASGCNDTVCRVSIAAIAALTPCAATRAQGIVQAQAAPPQIIQAQREVTVAERIVGLFAGGVGKLFDFAIANGPSYLNYRLGTVQSNNQTALGIVQSNNALGATQSTNGTFAAFGNNLQGTATAGYAATQNVAGLGFTAVGNVASNGFGAVRDVGMKPSLVVTGDGNNLINGTGNTTQSGSSNRQGSAGPCTAGNGGNQTGTATPGTSSTTPATASATTPTTTGNGGTGGASDCAK